MYEEKATKRETTERLISHIMESAKTEGNLRRGSEILAPDEHGQGWHWMAVDTLAKWSAAIMADNGHLECCPVLQVPKEDGHDGGLWEGAGDEWLDGIGEESADRAEFDGRLWVNAGSARRAFLLAAYGVIALDHRETEPIYDERGHACLYRGGEDEYRFRLAGWPEEWTEWQRWPADSRDLITKVDRPRGYTEGRVVSSERQEEWLDEIAEARLGGWRSEFRWPYDEEYGDDYPEATEEWRYRVNVPATEGNRELLAQLAGPRRAKEVVGAQWDGSDWIVVLGGDGYLYPGATPDLIF